MSYAEVNSSLGSGVVHGRIRDFLFDEEGEELS